MMDLTLEGLDLEVATKDVWQWCHSLQPLAKGAFYSYVASTRGL